MKRFRPLALFFCLLFLLPLAACQAPPAPEPVQSLRGGRFAAALDGDTLYYSRQQALCRWTPGDAAAECLSEGFFYPAESRTLTVLGGKAYSIRWDTGQLVSFDPVTGETAELAEIYDSQAYFAPGVLTACVWQWDGKLCCLSSNCFPLGTDILQEEFQMEIQLRDADGVLLDTIPLPVSAAAPSFACGEYLVYYAPPLNPGTAHIFNLETGEDRPLYGFTPYGMIDGRLLAADEYGNYYLFDLEDGTRAPYASTDSAWLLDADGWRYYKSGNSIYRWRPGGQEEHLAAFGVAPEIIHLDGMFAVQMDGALWLHSDALRLSDLTGENAELAETVNRERMAEYDGYAVLAFPPGDTVYLLDAF